MRWHNYDVKTIHRGTNYYTTMHAEMEQSGAVKNRESRVHDAYLAHARALDGAHHPRGTRPIENRLASFGRVRGFVFGAYGEASGDVHDLLSLAAQKQAELTWQASGARSQNEMYAFYMHRYRRQLGMASVLAMARHRLQRVPVIGVPREAVEDIMRRGNEGARGRAVATDLAEFYAFQVHYESGA